LDRTSWNIIIIVKILNIIEQYTTRTKRNGKDISDNTRNSKHDRTEKNRNIHVE